MDDTGKVQACPVQCRSSARLCCCDHCRRNGSKCGTWGSEPNSYQKRPKISSSPTVNVDDKRFFGEECPQCRDRQ